MKEHLSARWRALWERHHVPAEISNEAFERLYAAYANEHRGYHGPQHLAYCLAMFDQACFLAQHKDSLEAAIWYHDYVMEFGQTDNELQSMKVAQMDLSRFNMSALFVLQVCDNISATTHTGDAVDNDPQLIADIDLSSFGDADWQHVCENMRGLRKEDTQRTDPEFIVHRRRSLQQFLDRESIYYTPYFRALLEKKARENIAREIEILPQMLGYV
jgi:predicted metal-dependent HD superfamily phosphohydrolase